MTLSTSSHHHFNPLPPHGGRPLGGRAGHGKVEISIHSLRMEGDLWNLDTGQASIDHFNPLPPHGGRPSMKPSFFVPVNFNPLPPHGGRQPGGGFVNGNSNFNPLPPHGGRRDSQDLTFSSAKFQSTPSAWRETSKTQYYSEFVITFQSTPSAWRETPERNPKNLAESYFNPLPPHGGRPMTVFSSV